MGSGEACQHAVIPCPRCGVVCVLVMKDKDPFGFDSCTEHCSKHSFELTGERGPLCSAGALSREGVPLYHMGCWWEWGFNFQAGDPSLYSFALVEKSVAT